MIKAEREALILSILNEVGVASVSELSRRLGQVSSVTVRRDIARLAAQGVLLRSHGGAARLEAEAPARAAAEEAIGIETADAIILPPLDGRSAETLRGMARRRRIPFLAESAPQPGGTYLGPENTLAGRDLGTLAGKNLAGRIHSANILLVSHEALPNTRKRSDGFLDGFRSGFPGDVRYWRVDGRGLFKTALRASLDALEAHPEINVLFGVNDHSILAALEASDRLRLDNVCGFSVGGEGGALFDGLAAGRKLVACAALFPEIVGSLAVEVLSGVLAGAAMPAEVRTPHVVITLGNLAEFYRREEEGWALLPSALSIGGAPVKKILRNGGRPTVGFVPHYPSHEWYRGMQRAMQRRADELGLELVVAAPQAGIAREISALRRRIAQAAAAMIVAGDTVLINQGEASLYLAQALRQRADLTIVTNSLDVLECLTGQAGLKVVLTSGELQAKHRCLVGPSLGALFEMLRVDKAFLSVDGLTARFGPSSGDERLALAARRFAEASREVYLLADHSLVGQDANHRIVPVDRVDELITDQGSLPADRLALTSAGLRISLADEESVESEERPFRPAASPQQGKAGEGTSRKGRKAHA